MIYIKNKMNYVNNDTGFLTANEFNSIKNELANIVKYRNVLVDSDDSQLLKAIIAESKTLFYTDTGVANAIELKRTNEVDFPLDDNQVFIFNPSYTNTDMATIKIGNNDEKRLLLENNELPVGFLDIAVTYMATYKKGMDVFEIKNLTIGKTSDFVFSNLHNEATFIEVRDVELGTGLYNNATVYIDQNTEKYELAVIENPRTQKQNAIGIYKVIGTKKYVFFDGIIPDFVSGLTSGFKYYLSETTPGGVVDGTVSKLISIGRYLKDGKFLLNIEGDVAIDVNAPSYKVYNTTLINGETKEGVIFTDTSNIYTLTYDKLSFNASIAKKRMYATINNNPIIIDFAQEYTNDDFTIEIGALKYAGNFIVANDVTNAITLYLVGEVVVDTVAPKLSSTTKTFNTSIGIPLVKETVTASDNVNGSLTVVETGTVNFNIAGTYTITYRATDAAGNTSSIIHTYVVDAIVIYNTNITNPQTSNGITFTDPTNTMTLMFNGVTYDKTTPALISFIKVNGVVAKLDYAVEYGGKTFEVQIGTVRYIGTFTENENYSSPIIINIK